MYRYLCTPMALGCVVLTLAAMSLAGIYEWEWIDPNDHSLGRQESSTLCPDGAGRDAVPYADLDHLDLTQAWLQSAQLRSASFYNSTLTVADLSQADLTGANFRWTTLTDADLSHANLTDADFNDATLTGADLSHANLTGADFYRATLTGADFTGSEVRGASFELNSGFTTAQLYSTASYQAGDLSNIDLGKNDLTGWNFANQNLSGADFDPDWEPETWVDYTTLNDADFTGANLTDAVFGEHRYDVAVLVGAHFTQADTRGAALLDLNANTPDARNTIFPDGVVHGLVLASGETMRLWDYDPDSPLPVEVRDVMQIDADAVLRVVIEDAEWGSTLTFQDGIDVLLDGRLCLSVNPDDETTAGSLAGGTFDLFDWAGVTPTQFANILTESGLAWDLSNIYTTGQVTLMSVSPSGDFDSDGDVDGDDFLTWQSNFGRTIGTMFSDGNADRNGVVDGDDFLTWQADFGSGDDSASAAVPEPASIAPLFVLAAMRMLSRRARIA